MFETEAERLAHIQSRVDTIQRAIDFIEQRDADDVRRALAITSIHPHLVADPAQLVVKLRECITSGHTFGAWKAAQQICQNAGLEF